MATPYGSESQTLCTNCKMNWTDAPDGICSVSNSCRNEKMKLARQVDPEAKRQKEREYRQKNPEQAGEFRCSNCRSRDTPLLLEVLNDKHTKGRFQCLGCGNVIISREGSRWVPAAIAEQI